MPINCASRKQRGKEEGMRGSTDLAGRARARVTFFVFVLVMLISRQGAAQDAAVFPALNTPAEAQHSQHVFIYATSEPKKPRILDRKFFLLAGMATAATVLDVATTSHCMSTYAACQEGNPLLGSHPSQAKLYGVSFSMLAGQLLASAWIRRKMPNRHLWMIPPIVATGGHGLAAALNVRTMHQLSQ